MVTAGGLVALELLHKMAVAGDDLPDVLSFDRRHQRWVVRHINGAWVAGHADRLIEVQDEGGNALRSTAHHRFLTREVGWAEAHELRCGVSLVGMGKGRVEAAERIVLDEPVLVYDLEVEGTHNFAVTTDGAGAPPVVVHNSGGRQPLTAARHEITVL